MGRDVNFLCRTCKKNYYLGYGSCCSEAFDWAPGKMTLAEFDAACAAYPERTSPKNPRFRKCLEAHEGHDWHLWSSDWMGRDKKRDVLICNAGWPAPENPEPLATEYSAYEQIDLERAKD